MFGGWTIERAEELLNSLSGVLSARVVARPGGEIEEIHLLTTTEVEPKQTVRNVESALLARFDITVDHRKISVAQTHRDHAHREEEAKAPVAALMLHQLPGEGAKPRIVFLGHQVESSRAQEVRTRVTLEWCGERFGGEATGADFPRARLETLATATLDAISKAASSGRADEGAGTMALTLDGLKVVDALDRDFVLVAVHATDARGTTPLTGATTMTDNADRSVILATLQATDRWVRGRMSKTTSR